MAGFDKSFEASARKFPSNTAIIQVNNNEKYDKTTYKQLMKRVLQLTECLNKYISRKTCVCLALSSNLHPHLLPTLILSIHQLECAFYCINPDTINISVLNSIGIKYIVTSKNMKLNLNLTLLTQTEYFDIYETKNSKQINFNNISYVVQTSGTTGKNKIVKVTHECINSNISCLKEIFEINEKDVIFFGTPITFDPFIIEIMLALTTGAALFIVDEQIKNNKPIFLNILFGEKSIVTFLQTVPSLFLCHPEEYIKLVLNGDTSIRILALGGEKFPENILNYPRNNLKLFNLYGITEVSCWASVEEITTLPISLGTPLKDTKFQIKDDNDGVGHLYIGSKTRICLINNEDFSDSNKEIFRATGDLVKYDETSNKFYYISRTNDVIKRFGIKVNLNEINKLIYEITELLTISVWDEINYKLILFIILQENDQIIKNKIIDKLRIKLIHNIPKEYNPDFIEIIPSFPVNLNGKLDHKTLIQIYQNTSKKPKEFFQHLYSKYFGLSKYQIEQNKNKSFIEIGGNSITAIQLVSEFDGHFEYNSAALMAALLDSNKNYVSYISLIDEYLEPNTRTSKPSKISKREEKLVNRNDLQVQLKINWKYDLKACVDCTPLVFYHPSLGTLIASGSHANIFAIIDIKGNLISELICEDAIESTACLTTCKNYLIVGCNDGYVQCVEIKSGVVLWKYLCGNSVKSTCVLFENTRIIFGSYDKYLYCLNIEDGSISWKLNLNESIKSNVIIYKDNCYVATINGTFYSISITSTNINWKIRSNNPVFSSACLLKKENIILWADVKGFINCFDINNGTKVWEINTSSSIYSSIVNKNERILFNSLDHNVYCYEVNYHKYNFIYKIDLKAQISSTPSIFVLSDMCYFTVVNNKGVLFLFDFDTGVLRQQCQLGNEMFSSPVVYENCIFVGCRDNNLYCIEING